MTVCLVTVGRVFHDDTSFYLERINWQLRRQKINFVSFLSVVSFSSSINTVSFFTIFGTSDRADCVCLYRWTGWPRWWSESEKLLRVPFVREWPDWKNLLEPRNSCRLYRADQVDWCVRTQTDIFLYFTHTHDTHTHKTSIYKCKHELLAVSCRGRWGGQQLLSLDDRPCLFQSVGLVKSTAGTRKNLWGPH